MTNDESAVTLQPPIRRLALAVAAFTTLLLVARFLPTAQFFTPLSYLPVHTALEFVAMAVSLMVFGLGWNPTATSCSWPPPSWPSQ